ncbi:kelch-like protein 9 [Acanthaster planci]|uniref:Kelch-like protein 9 n=1 Tax=Acanthaster planci TaxID=133434 RepID=A0A8B7Y1A8_ACAPL|nr:kelch-like protein 9 [Acanthaster planci]
MSDTNEAFVFRANKSDDNELSDIWDDTALIKAYDKAIKTVRGEASNEESGGPENGRKSAKSGNQRKKRKHWSQKRHKKHTWKVGDRCRAIYTEDEYTYDAVIKLIDHDRGTCWVTFVGYGNEEEKDLDDLMSAGSEVGSPSRPVNGDFEAGYESMEYSNHNQSPAPSGSGVRGNRLNAYSYDNHWYPSQQPFRPPIPPPVHWPPHPMSHGFTLPGFPSYPPFHGHGYMPQGLAMPVPPLPSDIPPPTPMSIPAEAQQGDEEALHTMLMSWYMSGYHTGYYQGLKQGRGTSQTASPQNQDQRRRQSKEWQSRSRTSGAQSRSSSSITARASRFITVPFLLFIKMLRWKNRKKSSRVPAGQKLTQTTPVPPIRTEDEERTDAERDESLYKTKSETTTPVVPRSPKTIGVVLPELPGRQSKLSTLLEVSHPNVTLPSSDAPHAEHVLGAMTALWRQKQLNDVVLAIGPHRIGTHKLVLAACSGYFSELFTGENLDSEEFVYKLHGISFDTLKLLLESMYTGNLPIDSSTLEEVLAASVYLKLSFALKICCDYMIENMETFNCLRTLGLATVFGLTRVMEEASKMAARNFGEITDAQEFLELPEKPLMTLLARDDLVVDSELTVFAAVLRWIELDRETRLGHAAALLENVRLPMIKPADLVDHVESTHFLMELPSCEALVREALHYYCLPLRQSILQSSRTTPRSTMRLTTVVALGGQPRKAKDSVGDVLTYYNSETKKWRVLTKMIQPRHHHAAAVLGGFLYVMGGRELVNNMDDPLKSAFRYDPRTESWIQIADMRNARESFQMGVLDGMIYAIGGRQSSEISLAAVERYNPSTDQWEERAQLCAPRRGVAVAVRDGKLYAVGGSGNRKVSNKVECYCPASDTWKQKRDLQTPRFFASLSSVGDYLYLTGGATVNPPEGVRCVPQIDRYEPGTDTWTTLPAVMGQPRAEAASCLVGNRIYILGGYSWDKKCWLESVECYDVEAREWSEIADYPQAYTGMACCCLTLHKLP